MATYKVPQDVEADDKLIGPFSFRQFVYLIIVAIGIGGAWGLWMIFPPLVLIPLPVIVLFGALALPLKKDQPMETYLAALVSYFLKPRKRLWVPDGRASLIEITAPKVVEIQRTKTISQTEAEQRLDYLAGLADTRGWSIRGIAAKPQPQETSMNPDMYVEARNTEDVLDETNSVSRNLDYMIEKTDARRHQEMVERLRTPSIVTAHPQVSSPAVTQAQPTQQQPIYQPPNPYGALQDPTQQPIFNPYPTDMNQSVVQPLSPTAQISGSTPPAQAAPPTPPTPLSSPEPTPPPESTSNNQLSPDIISLANNPDLSIETIAREAHRIHDKEDAPLDDGEVLISLR